MLDCREVKPLLALWIGQDLPDTATANEVAGHLNGCPECDRYRLGLQSSLEALQSLSDETLSDGFVRGDLRSKLMSRISEWDSRRHHHRFNGWIPAAVMTVAVALMVAVSIPSLHEEFFGNSAGNGQELTFSHPELRFIGDPNVDRPNEVRDSQVPSATPVVYRPDQW